MLIKFNFTIFNIYKLKSLSVYVFIYKLIKIKYIMFIYKNIHEIKKYKKK